MPCPANQVAIDINKKRIGENDVRHGKRREQI